MFTIEDELHSENHGEFPTFDGALAELRHRASIPWDVEPNRAPCTSWRTCGRDYEIAKYDDESSRAVFVLPALRVSSSGTEWLSPFVDGGLPPSSDIAER
jgi:hypothetical protein